MYPGKKAVVAQAPADSPDHVFPLLRGGCRTAAVGSYGLLFLLPALIGGIVVAVAVINEKSV